MADDFVLEQLLLQCCGGSAGVGPKKGLEENKRQYIPHNRKEKSKKHKTNEWVEGVLEVEHVDLSPILARLDDVAQRAYRFAQLYAPKTYANVCGNVVNGPRSLFCLEDNDGKLCKGLSRIIFTGSVRKGGHLDDVGDTFCDSGNSSSSTSTSEQFMFMGAEAYERGGSSTPSLLVTNNVLTPYTFISKQKKSDKETASEEMVQLDHAVEDYVFTALIPGCCFSDTVSCENMLCAVYYYDQTKLFKWTALCLDKKARISDVLLPGSQYPTVILAVQVWFYDTRQ